MVAPFRFRLVLSLLCCAVCAAPAALAWETTCGLLPGALHPGMFAPGEVLELQQRLTQLGYYQGPATEVYSAELEAALRQFQRDHGLVVDGIVGDATWQALAGPVRGESGVVVAASQQPPPKGEMHIVVDIDRLRLTLWVDGKPYKSYPVAVGVPSGQTWSPVGEWKIVNKGKWSGGFGTRWMGLNVPWGTYGIHGTNKPYTIGTRASHGCIRMYNRDVEELYSWVPVGTKVIIEGRGEPVKVGRALQQGATGKDVVLVQKRLAEKGFATGGADGRYGPATAEAVRALQRLYGLPADGTVYEDVYYLLGLK